MKRLLGLILIGILVLTAAPLSTYLGCSERVLLSTALALADDGVLPAALGRRGASGAPVRATLLQSAWVSVLVLSGTFESLVHPLTVVTSVPLALIGVAVVILNAKTLGVSTDGKILLTGMSENGTEQDVVLIRYNSDGTLDTSFGGDTDGFVTKLDAEAGSLLYTVRDEHGTAETRRAVSGPLVQARQVVVRVRQQLVALDGPPIHFRRLFRLPKIFEDHAQIVRGRGALGIQVHARGAPDLVAYRNEFGHGSSRNRPATARSSRRPPNRCPSSRPFPSPLPPRVNP